MNEPIYQVSELNEAVRDVLEHGFNQINVEGEISNLSKPASGHLYFSLKDEHASVSCALFKGNRYQLRMPWQDIDNGLLIRANGRVSLYAPRGQYQLILNTIEPAGVGALEREYQARLQHLQAEGLFTPTKKRQLPTQPQNIGVITSPSGAAVRDIMTTIKRRNPLAQIIIYPTLVQGNDAPAQILSALSTANRRKECDVLLLVRGGGSLEDLWAFNDEALVRAVADSQIITISGVGHEIDFTLTDFAADIRAPTPTAAAEIVSPPLSDFLAQQHQRIIEVTQQITRHIDKNHQQIQHLSHRLKQQNPSRYLKMQTQRVDELQLQLHRVMRRDLEQRKQELQYQQQRIHTSSPTQHLAQEKQRLELVIKQLHRLSAQSLREKQQYFLALTQCFELLSPLGVLNRGYALAQKPDGKIVRAITEVAPNDNIRIRLPDGTLHCQVKRRVKNK